MFIGEKPLVSLGARGKFNVLECDSRTITRVCRSSMAAETRGLGLTMDSSMIKSRPRKVDSRNKKALTLEIATIREWLVTSGAQIRWTADENMIMNGLTKDHRESRQHMARILQERERESGAHRKTLR